MARSYRVETSASSTRTSTMTRDEELLAECQRRFSYNPNTGVFAYRKNYTGRAGKGGRVGRVNGQGHRIVGVLGTDYMLAQVCWLLIYHRKPYRVHFIDGDHTNLKHTNLKLPDAAMR